MLCVSKDITLSAARDILKSPSISEPGQIGALLSSKTAANLFTCLYADQKREFCKQYGLDLSRCEDWLSGKFKYKQALRAMQKLLSPTASREPSLICSSQSGVLDRVATCKDCHAVVFVDLDNDSPVVESLYELCCKSACIRVVGVFRRGSHHPALGKASHQDWFMCVESASARKQSSDLRIVSVASMLHERLQDKRVPFIIATRDEFALDLTTMISTSGRFCEAVSSQYSSALVQLLCCAHACFNDCHIRSEALSAIHQEIDRNSDSLRDTLWASWPQELVTAMTMLLQAARKGFAKSKDVDAAEAPSTPLPEVRLPSPSVTPPKPSRVQRAVETGTCRKHGWSSYAWANQYSQGWKCSVCRGECDGPN
eukprot:TRINITY_DN12750_c0_g1_i1.p1 TRINITY_DN12750_c0_g1~~TRINITY_DN12750_c0_g1_i1.p1  ORF type:complete len:370 (+),score=30.76 TRINITY_DN12750_c0_g1_i1:117-1226(+)